MVSIVKLNCREHQALTMVSSMKLNPQDHLTLESDLITFHVTRLGLKKVHKVEPDRRFKGHESSQPQAVYKVAK